MIARLAAGAAAGLWAASAAAQTQPAPAGIGAGQIVGLFAGTLFVLAVIAGIAWLLRRFSPGAVAGGSMLRVVAGAAVGQRERVVIVEVGTAWLVVGVAPGSVSLLREMPRAETATPAVPAPPASPAFAAWLRQFMEKRNGQ